MSLPSADEPLRKVERYYTARFAEHGATAQGVDWNSAASQELRFRQLLRLVEGRTAASILDYGCGYGAFVPVLAQTPGRFTYTGFDIALTLLEHARETYADLDWCTFVHRTEDLGTVDFAVASGIFNVKLDVDSREWEKHVMATLDRLAELATKGFAFNMLTSYSDPRRMRPDLYYGDPSYFFDWCKRHYSRDVALLHDYGLYEFTILTRKELL